MRLLNVHFLRLETFQDAQEAPAYVILSHRWGEGEVLFEDLQEHPLVDEIVDLRSQVYGLQHEVASLRAGLKSEREPSFQTPSIEIQVNGEPVLEEEEGPTSYRSVSMRPSYQVLASRKSAWSKVTQCCEEAQRFGVDYVWIDTCCIDQRSSSELSEAINSMFAWYRDAKLCMAYLSDVSRPTYFPISGDFMEFQRSNWFSRGWTLQELVAPREVWFFDAHWRFLALRSDLAVNLSLSTGIHKNVLSKGGLERLRSFSVATRLSWAANRVTTRPEDRAYSLLGLFGVSMPILYGEGGHSAFFRLQEQIFRILPDHSILAWNAQSPIDTRDDVESSLFAPSPDCFSGCTHLKSVPYDVQGLINASQWDNDRLFESTGGMEYEYSSISHGLRIQLLMRDAQDTFSAKRIIESRLACESVTNADSSNTPGIAIIQLVRGPQGQFRRLGQGPKYLAASSLVGRAFVLGNVYLASLQRELSPHQVDVTSNTKHVAVSLDLDPGSQSRIERGYCNLTMKIDRFGYPEPFQITSLATLGNEILPLGVHQAAQRQLSSEQDHLISVFKVGTREGPEIFAVLCVAIASRLKAVIITGLKSSAFEEGVVIRDTNSYDWHDLSKSIAHSSLPWGKVIFASAKYARARGKDTVTVMVGIRGFGVEGIS